MRPDATISPTLILDTPADLQLIAFPVGIKVRFARSFNLQQYCRVRIEETKQRRTRQDLHRSITIYLGAAGDAGQHDFDSEAHGTNLIGDTSGACGYAALLPPRCS